MKMYLIVGTLLLLGLNVNAKAEALFAEISTASVNRVETISPTEIALTGIYAGYLGSTSLGSNAYRAVVLRMGTVCFDLAKTWISMAPGARSLRISDYYSRFRIEAYSASLVPVPGNVPQIRSQDLRCSIQYLDLR
jgi:hypothetical protein